MEPALTLTAFLQGKALLKHKYPSQGQLAQKKRNQSFALTTAVLSDDKNTESASQRCVSVLSS